DLSQKRQVGRRDAKRLHPEIDPATIEDAEDCVFAMHGRERRHAQVDQTPVDTGADAPVLRQPAFRYVEARQYLETTQQGRLIRLGVRRTVLENAVDPIPNLDGLLERLDVDVRCAEHYAPPNDVVGQLGGGHAVVARDGHGHWSGGRDNRRLLRRHGRPRGGECLVGHTLGARRRGAGSAAVDLLDQPRDSDRVGRGDTNWLSGRPFEGANGTDVERVAHGDDERASVEAERNDLLQVRDRRGDVRRRRRVDDQISPLEERDVGVLRKRSQKIALADVAERDECLANPLAGADAPVQRLVELRLGDETRFDQRLTEPNSARHGDVVAGATGCAPETRSAAGWRTTPREGRGSTANSVSPGRTTTTIHCVVRHKPSRRRVSKKKPPRGEPWRLLEVVQLPYGFFGGVEGRGVSSVSPATVNSSRCDPPLSRRSMALRSGAS